MRSASLAGRFAKPVILALIGASTLAGCNTAGQGAFSGAAIGALAGMGLGSLNGDMGKGAAAGAILGGVFGGVLGDQNDRASWRGRGDGGGGYGSYHGGGWRYESWHSHHYHNRCRGW